MVTHESGSQTGATGMKLYSVAYSTWNSSFSDLNRHNILAVGTGAEEAIQRAKQYLFGTLSAMLDLGRGSGPMDHMWDLHSRFLDGEGAL